MTSQASFLHDNHFLEVLLGAENGGHLCLVQNIVYLLLAHSVEESNSCGTVVHASNETADPFPSVLRPNSKESPHLALSFNLWKQLKVHQTLGKSLASHIEVTICRPFVFSIGGATLCVCANFLSCSKEVHVSTTGHISSIDFEKSIDTGSKRTWLGPEIIIVLVVNLVTD